MKHGHLLAAVLLAAASAAAAPRSTLAVYLDALSISNASACAHLSPSTITTTATHARPSERFILRTLLETHPEVAPLTACLVSSGLVPAAVVERWGGALLFAAASPRLFAAATGEPAALFTGLLSRGAAWNHTLGRGDAFNLVHKILSADKRAPDEMASALLQPSPAHASHLERLALGIAEGLPAPTAAAALAAGRHLLRSHALGRPVASSAISTLARAMSMRLLGALAAAPPPPHQPTLAALAAQRDKFGRSPLHMAALQDSAPAAALLAAALLAQLPPAQAVRALCARDGAGFTALDLAVCLGHSLAARELQKALGAACPVQEELTHPTTSLLPALLAPAFPSPRSALAAAPALAAAAPRVGDGGWGAPARMSLPARAALAAAAAAAASTGGCDVDVVSAAELSGALFVREYFLPLRPVLVRGLAAPLARAWRRSVLLRAHGNLTVNPAGIPYAASFGGAGEGGMALADFVGRHLVVGAEGAVPPYVFQRVSPASALAAHSMLLAPPFLAQARLPLAGHNGSIALLLPTPDALSPEFFLGPPGSGAPLHFHGDAVNFLAWGRKEWFLQPPAAAEYSTAAAVDFVTHELPGLRAAGRAPLQCSQAAGDALYVPRGWGHAVLNLNTSVGWVVEFSHAMRRY